MPRVGLEALFTPESVAVVGASRNPQKLGHRLVKNLLEYGFDGRVYPINIEGGEVLGLPAYSKVAAVEGPVDLVLVSVPSERVLATVEDCAAASVGALVILASGFGEADIAGKDVEERILKLARASGMRVLGPNCMGIYNIHGRLNGTYFWELPRNEGKVSFLSQSGAYGGILFKEAQERGLGISKFVSIGNQVDLSYAELVEYLGADDDTSVIALFIEEVKGADAFLREASRVSRRKPIVTLKAGRTEAGRRAARSHTGSLAGTAAVYEGAFRQAGIIAARGTEDFLDSLRALARYSGEPPADDRVAIATISGGPCVIASDACEELGLSVPPLNQETRAKIRRYIPPFGADSNPVDMTPQMLEENFGPCVDVIFAAPEISGVIGINVGLDTPSFSQAFLGAQKRHGKPLVVFTASAPTIENQFREAGVPLYPSPDRAARAYYSLVQYSRFASRPHELWPDAGEPSPILSALEQGRSALNEHDAKEVLKGYGIPVCREAVATSADEAAARGTALGFPVVAKVLSEGVLHKTETAGIFLNLHNEAGVRQAAGEIFSRFPGALVLVQEQVKPGLELLVGATRDPSFGPVIAFGLGGVYTELFKDVVLRVAPLRPSDAREMMREIKGAALLSGYRGGPAVDEAALVDLLLKVSRLITGNPSIRELDINPLMVSDGRLVAVDALIAF